MTESTYFEREAQKHPFVIALIPAYNESSYIKTVITETRKYVSSIIVVDDGSLDKTSEIAASVNAIVVRNKRNMGKGFAIKRGLTECLKYNPDIVVTIDADGQHNPSEIPKLLDPIISGEADAVVGSRYHQESITDAPKLRRIGLYILNSINRVLVRTSVKDAQSGYKAYTKNALSTILKCDSIGYGVEVEQLAALESSGFRIIEVPVSIKYKGLVNTSKKGSVSEAFNIGSTIFRIAVEKKPLLFFGLSGFILVVISVIPALEMLNIFNETRYFSLPLAVVSLSIAFPGSILILMSFVFFALKRIRQREEIIATTLVDLLNKIQK